MCGIFVLFSKVAHREDYIVWEDFRNKLKKAPNADLQDFTNLNFVCLL